MKRIAASMLAAFLSTGATAPQSSGMVHMFECDTASGRASAWAVDTSQRPVQLSGTLQVEELRLDPRWGPTATVFVRRTDRTDGTGFRIVWSARDSTFSRVDFIAADESVQPEQVGELKQVKGPVPFSITIAADGHAIFKLADFERTADVAGYDPARLELGCSTGDIGFSAIKVE